MIKHRNLFRPGHTQKLSVAKILLALLSSKTPRNELKTLNALVDFIIESYSHASIARNSAWFQPALWSKIIRISPLSVCEIFSNLVSNCVPMHLEMISAPLVSLAFSLLTARSDEPTPGIVSILTASSLASLLNLSHRTTSSRYFSTDLSAPAAVQGVKKTMESGIAIPSSPFCFGAWLLCNIFITNEHTRTQILR